MKTRRNFLRTVALTAVAVAAAPRGALAAVENSSVEGSRVDLDYAGFDYLRGSSFRMRGADGTVQTVVLEDVTHYPRSPEIENFSVRFMHETPAPLGQGTYRFSHPRMGEFDLFVVSQHAETGRCGYTAVFNRLV
jgi:hypothetical protein